MSWPLLSDLAEEKKENEVILWNKAEVCCD